jgi:hypothetical protein
VVASRRRYQPQSHHDLCLFRFIVVVAIAHQLAHAVASRFEGLTLPVEDDAEQIAAAYRFLGGDGLAGLEFVIKSASSLATPTVPRTQQRAREIPSPFWGSRFEDTSN